MKTQVFLFFETKAANMAISQTKSFVGNAPSAHDAAVEMHRDVTPELSAAVVFAQRTENISRFLGTIGTSGDAPEWLEYGQRRVEAFTTTREIMNKASEGRAALQGLQIHKAILQQRQLDFIRLKSDARLARIAARSGSDAAAAAESFLRPLVDETRMLRHNDQQSVRYFEDLSKELGQSATSKIGKIALKAEDFMGKSQLGRAILDKTLPFANHSFNHILNFAGVATAAWKAHEENPSLNGVERTVHTGMAAGFQFISTGLQVADPFIVLGARAFGASEKQAEGYTAGKFFSGLEQEFFAMGQAAWRHDSTPMDEWQQRAMSGAYGKVWQGYENTAYQLGAMGYNVATKVANVAGKVSQSYTKSLSWWEALGHARS